MFREEASVDDFLRLACVVGDETLKRGLNGGNLKSLGLEFLKFRNSSSFSFNFLSSLFSVDFSLFACLAAVIVLKPAFN